MLLIILPEPPVFLLLARRDLVNGQLDQRRDEVHGVVDIGNRGARAPVPAHALTFRRVDLFLLQRGRGQEFGVVRGDAAGFPSGEHRRIRHHREAR